MNTTISIVITPSNEISFQADQPVPITDLIDAFNTIIYDAMCQARNNPEVKPEHKPRVEEALFDLYNESASNVLAAFAPDKDLRPDITSEAILAQELRLARKKIDKAKPKSKSKHLNTRSI